MEISVTGDKFLCISAATQFYVVGKEYEVVIREGKKGFIAEDGLFDPLGRTSSKFKKVKNEATKRESKRKATPTEDSQDDPKQSPESGT